MREYYCVFENKHFSYFSLYINIVLVTIETFSVITEKINAKTKINKINVEMNCKLEKKTSIPQSLASEKTASLLPNFL